MSVGHEAAETIQTAAMPRPRERRRMRSDVSNELPGLLVLCINCIIWHSLILADLRFRHPPVVFSVFFSPISTELSQLQPLAFYLPVCTFMNSFHF